MACTEKPALLLNDYEPENVRDTEEEDVDCGLGMATENDHRSDYRGHREPGIGTLLDQKVDLMDHGWKEAGRRALGEVQPADDEGAETVGDRGDAAREEVVAPQAIR